MTVFFPELQGIERRRIIQPVDCTRLHRLEKPQHWGERLWSEVAVALAGVPFEQYPSYPEFYTQLANHFDVDPASLVVGAGIEDFIRSLMMLHRGRRVAVMWPTCAMFEIYARAFNVALVPLDVRESETDLPLDVAAVILINPSQPFDTHLPYDTMRQVADYLQGHGIMLVIDEAYHGFGAQTALGLQNEFDNVLIMRTFSKAYGAAGIRVGWAVGSPSIVQAMHAVRPSGEISAHSMAVASVLMRLHQPHVEDSIEEITEGRDYLRGWCEMTGLQVRGSWANFVTMWFGPYAERVVGDLRARGVFVRHVEPDHIMVTCGSVPLMKQFIKEFTDVIAAI